jgi:hypothetical protein
MRGEFRAMVLPAILYRTERTPADRTLRETETRGFRTPRVIANDDPHRN